MKLPEPYRACSCRDPMTGRLLGKQCADLAKKGHGGWYARPEAPRAADGKRRRPRIGPYRPRKECEDKLIEVLGTLGQGGHVDDRRTRFGEHLDRRLRWWESEGELKSIDSYREAIELYLRPAWGHLRLMDMRG